LNGAIHLEWDDNAYTAAPTRFKWYRIYSTRLQSDTGLCRYELAARGHDGGAEFLASAMTNGVPAASAFGGDPGGL